MFIRRYLLVTIVMGLLFIVTYGCSDSGDGPTGSNGGGTIDTISFVTDIRDTLNVRCAKSGCHVNGSRAGGYSMGDVGNVIWDSLISAVGNKGGPIIVVGDASSSYLYTMTTPTPPMSLPRMPDDGTTLSIQAQDNIRDWINQGALDN